MDNKEIALRLVEVWGNQQGLPSSFQDFNNNYFEMLEKLENKTNHMKEKK